MSVKIEIPISLKRLTDNMKFIECRPGKLKDILKNLKTLYPEFSEKIFNKDGELKSYIIILLDGEIIKKSEIHNLIIKEKQLLKLLLAIGGG